MKDYHLFLIDLDGTIYRGKETIESGVMTGDLYAMWEGEIPAQKVNSLDFLKAIRGKLEEKLA